MDRLGAQGKPGLFSWRRHRRTRRVTAVRKLLGVGFPGEPAKVETLLGEMEVTEDPATVAAIEVRKTQLRFGAIPLGDRVYRVVVPAEGVAGDRTVPPILEEFKQRLRAFAGTDFGVHPPRWLSASVTPPGCRALPGRPGAAGRRRLARNAAELMTLSAELQAGGIHLELRTGPLQQAAADDGLPIRPKAGSRL